jgi:outer membrane protein assembly factor BamD
MKDFKIAKLFYRMDDYTAAIQMFNNILKEYPDSPHREEIMFLIIKSYYKFAMESILEKQLDRFTKAMTACNEFIAQYPDSKLKTEAVSLKERSQKELELYNIKFQKRGNHVPIVIN